MTKARRGLNVGGRVYGYENVETKEGHRRVRVECRIHEGQAEIIREIIRRYAGGDGLKTIAKALNARGVPAPRAGRRGVGAWCAGSISPMLHRERYQGVLVWGKKEKTYRGGTKVRVSRPEEEWIRVEVPELRIVNEELWIAAPPAPVVPPPKTPTNFLANSGPGFYGSEVSVTAVGVLEVRGVRGPDRCGERAGGEGDEQGVRVREPSRAGDLCKRDATAGRRKWTRPSWAGSRST